MQKRRIHFLFLFVLICTLLSGIFIYTWNRRSGNSKKPVKITAVELFKSFTTNEQKSNILYLNKTVEVSGKISRLKKNLSGKTVVYLESKNDVFGVNCTFKQTPKLMHEGDIITLNGICTGYLSDVVLNQCLLISRNK